VTLEKKHLFLIDGSGYIFRAYYALPPLYRKSDGLPTGAVNGFCNMLFKLIEDTKSNSKPTHLAVIFDNARKTFRNDIYSEYKANRGEPPEDLIPQFQIIKDSVKAFGIPSIELAGFEADDIIATYAKQAADKDWKVSIVSSDKDLMQVVTKDINLIDTMKNKSIGIDEVKEKFGVAPDRVIDVQALAGDSSDNVPGAPGIGLKTAALLINEYDNLENLLESAEKIKQNKRRESLINNKELIKISKQLVTLKNDVTDIQSLDTLNITNINYETLLPFLHDLELFKLKERLTKKNPNLQKINIISEKKISKEKINIKKIEKNNEESSDIFLEKSKYISITSINALELLIKDIRDQGYFVFDLETDSLDVIDANLAGVAICLDIKRSYYIPLTHKDEHGELFKEQANFKDALKLLNNILSDSSLLKIGHNIKYDIAVLKKYKIEVISFEDTMLMSYINDAGNHRHGMDELAKVHFNRDTIKFKDVVGSGKSQITFDYVEIEKATEYAAEDAEITFKLYLLLKKKLIDGKNLSAYNYLEKSLVPSILEMEINGIKLNTEYLKSLSSEFEKKINILEKEIFKLCGVEFNIGSPKQLGDVLFNQLKLTPPKKTKTGEFSTGIEVLEDLAFEGNKVAEDLIIWRQLSKLKNTYTEALQSHINKTTKRIHTSYAMASTNTGRLSSSDPNLQNIPIRSPEGRLIRKSFIAEKGYKILSADYSQVELRVLAHIAKIEPLIEAFKNGEDIHALTASEIFGTSLEKVTPDLRRRAKAVNFGIIYGISGFGLAKQLSITNHEANNFIKKYFDKFPGIKKYMEDTKALCREQGYVETLCGRKCFFPKIKDKNFAYRSFQERAAINAPIQGSAADIIKRAMIKIHAKNISNNDDCKMLLQVHDELIFEVKDSKIDKFQTLIRQEMENALDPLISLDVPLLVESSFGNNWDEAH
jgi:DNA polymerase-1|tara:strand:+ start:5204 stop:8020 length:2817 start_codon:yes stop_codon:yes gene_type:complete